MMTPPESDHSKNLIKLNPANSDKNKIDQLETNQMKSSKGDLA